ncbi:polyprotein of EF-Ts, chloroplastic isoform X2 [Gastrolobium bilobum]|uniref:polyprotein of EF-Ts, chloroplastic isoform X2 n=1 Tax=Gastrolobium bilobum TaxID=150636 RepID=UPI002AB2BBC4|nr:polyprotein of EF-Ts, chloroplastic isoform X2 [Gastrolobium bilobum]
MNPVIPCSVGNVSIIPGITYPTRKNNILTRLSLSRSSTKPRSSTRRFLLPSFVASGVFPQNKRICSFYKKSRTSISATETEVAVEEPGSPVADEVSGDIPSNEVGVSEDSPPKSDANPAPAKIRRSRPARKSEMPPVKNEDLIPGATFTGKVKSVQPFGAFIDFGAFTDGLVHVSMLSDSYVKDVASVVSVGQEVKVKLIEVNTETQRISLSMRENADTGKQRKDAPLDTEKAGPGRRNTSKPSPRKDGMKKSTKFVKGQELQGTVKNMTRSGAFISLPEGEEGFLPISEESSDGFESAMGNSSLQVGQEVSVRVLRITRGSVTLTMKNEEDTAVSDSAVGQGVVHNATNPFQLAFRKNKDIAAFLDEREKVQNEVQKSSTTRTLEEIKGTVNQGETLLDVPDLQGEPESIKLTDDAPSAVKYAEDDISENADEGAKALDGFSTATVDDESNLVSNVSSPNPVIDGATEKEIEVDSAILAAEGDLSTVNPIIEESTQIDVTTSNVNTDSPVEIANENVIESGVDHVVVEDKKESQTSNEKEEIAATVLTDSDAVEPSPDKIGTITASDIASSAPTPQETAVNPLSTDRKEENDQAPSPESSATEVVQNPVDPKEVEEQTPATENEDSLTSQVEDKEVSNIGAVPGNNDGDTSFSGQNGNLSLEGSLNEDGMEENDQVPSPESSATEVVKNPIDPTEEVEKQTPTSEDENSFTSQVEDKEVAIASKQNGNVGAVSEDNDGDTSLNGQNDELSPEGSLNKDRTEENDQVPSPESYATEVVKTPIDPKEVEEQTPVAENEDSLTSQVEDKEVSNIGAVPEDNEGDTSLSGQNGDLSVEDSLNEDGMEENDQVPSPESLATEVVRNCIDDLKEEGKNQTPAIQIENSFTSQVEDKEVAIAFNKNSSLSNSNGQTGNTGSDQGLSKATISPALVKQLREETGAGMMDCKKALSETGGDIIKAQEFLRKKGLSSAEKKASRVTAEGRIGSYIHDSRIGVLVEVNCETDFVSRGEIFKELVDDIAMQVAACPQVEYLVTEDVPEEIVNKEKEIEMQKEDLLSKPEQIRSKIVEGRIKKRLEELALLEQPYIKSDKVAVKDWVKQTIATIGENIKVKRFVRFNLGEGLEKKSQDFAAEVAAQTAAKQASPPVKEQPAVAEAKETEQKQSTVTVSASLVKQLREETGAGMMDCKKALAETGGDLEKAQEYLRKKGLSTADKKSSRLAAEGRIGSYIHDSRIGVLIEVNCETDFVGRSEKFKELVDDLAMQVVASPQVQFVSIEDIPEAIVNKEKELEMQREDLLSKPEKIREKIVEGRVSKRLGELVLLEQPFIKDDSLLVKDLVKQSVAAIGENIKVRRFIRFTLGETAEKETTIPA